MKEMGFELKNPRNWTYATPDIYLSDMHDENVIRSNKSDTIFVVDCDIRINTPELRQGGIRLLTTEVRCKDWFVVALCQQDISMGENTAPEYLYDIAS